MKKFLFVLLAAALALPMMAQMTPATRNGGVDRARSNEMSVMNPLNEFNGSLMSAPQMRADGTLVWDFEAGADDWMNLDNDGDGNGWELDDYYGHNGPYCVLSRSFYGGALDPDNWLISPEVPLGGMLTFWAMNWSSSYPDNIAIYVCEGTPENINDFVKVSDDIVAPTSWTEYTVDLAAYAGKTGCFAIRHYDSYDQYRIYIDDISLTASLPAAPENVTVDPAATTAEVAWDDAENVAWNLRYREAVEVENLAWDFEEESDIADWTLVDSDGDGFNWQYFNNTGLTSGLMTTHEGMGLMASASYDKNSGAALYPDNWMISPKVRLDGKLSFWAAGQDPSYAAEVFGVYVSTDMENWQQLGEDFTATGEYVEYTFDLSSRAGEEGYFAIRHYNVTDMFWLNIDDVTLTYGEPNEWIVVEGVTSPYTIEGLTPETNYEVEVQGVNEEGAASVWTESVPFTTLAEDPVVPPVVDQVGAPTFEGYTVDGIHGYGVHIYPTTEGSSIMYRVFVDEDGEWVLVTDWTEYEGVDMEIWMTEADAKYRVEAYAYIGEVQSQQVAYEFVVQPFTGINEMNAGKAVAGVRYFNVAGQEMSEANGLTIVVTTYTDGTTSASKVVK